MMYKILPAGKSITACILKLQTIEQNDQTLLMNGTSLLQVEYRA